MKLNDLHDVLVHEIKDLYHAEKQLVKSLPRMAKAAQTEELQAALEDHLAVTENQVSRLEECFQELELAARGVVCHGMKGLIEESKELIEAKKDADPESLDAALIGAAQKVEHYEISAYGTCRAHAEKLGLSRVAELLQQTLDEEVEADELLTRLAQSHINAMAASHNGHHQE